MEDSLNYSVHSQSEDLRIKVVSPLPLHAFAFFFFLVLIPSFPLEDIFHILNTSKQEQNMITGDRQLPCA